MQREITPDEFETEALPHLKDLYRTTVRLVRDRGEAEDLVQDVYLQAWKSYQKYEPGTNCRAWLYKILFNKIDHHRRRKYSRAKWLDADRGDALVFVEAPAASPTPEIRDEKVLEALDRVTPRFREVVLLADVEEFSYKEVAGILGIPIGTVMSRLSRGRAHLRRMLANIALEYGIRQAA